MAPFDLEALAEEVRRRHGAHTVLLYGSRARGDAGPDSDVDVIAIRPVAGRARDLQPWRGFAMDVHVVGDPDLERFVAEHSASLRDARVACERDGVGERILAAVRERLASPPPASSEGERAALWAWGDKMRKRVEHPKATVAALHRATLLVESLGAWAEVRGRWYFGGKAALGSLPVEDPAMLAAWTDAARPEADASAFHRLLDVVFDPRLRPANEGGPVTERP